MDFFPKKMYNLRQTAQRQLRQGLSTPLGQAAVAVGADYAGREISKSVRKMMETKTAYRATKKRKRAAKQIQKKPRKGVVKNNQVRGDKFTKRVKNIVEGTKPVGTFVKAGCGHLVSPALAPNFQVLALNMQQKDADVPGYDFAVFHLRKILDAASVLFNGKVRAYDYNITTNNFVVKDTVIDVQYASCTYKITNKSTKVVNVEAMVFEPKRSSTDSAGGTFPNAFESVRWVGGNITTGDINPNNAVPTTGSLGVIPTMFPEFNRLWGKSTSKLKKLNPG